MELSVTLDGSGSVAETGELRAWLHDARIREVERVTQETTAPKPGEQGPTLLAILTIILGSRALVELARSLHRYIEARRPKVKLTIKTRKKLIEIDCTNPPPLDELVKEAKFLADD